MILHTHMHPPISEIKFLVDPVLGERIRQWARTHINPDPHGTGRYGDEYWTSSLYFDTTKHDTFHRRGSFGRTKYRIRRYTYNDFVFLERKLKTVDVLIKRRTKTPLTFLQLLEHPETNNEWCGKWFHRRLLVRNLLPTCQISYHRTAWITPETGTRLTLDDCLNVTPITSPHFSHDSGIPFLDQQLILELKFRGSLPNIYTQLIDTFHPTPQSVSKYQYGMITLGHIPKEQERLVA